MKLAIILSHANVLAALTTFVAESHPNAKVGEVEFSLNDAGEIKAFVNATGIGGQAAIETKDAEAVSAPKRTRRSSAEVQAEKEAAIEEAPKSTGRRTRTAAAPAEPEYDADGFNKDGFDKDGFDADGFDKDGFDAEGYNENDEHRDDLDAAEPVEPEPTPVPTRRRRTAAAPVADTEEDEEEEATPAPTRTRRGATTAAAAPAVAEAAPARTTRKRIFNK